MFTYKIIIHNTDLFNKFYIHFIRPELVSLVMMVELHTLFLIDESKSSIKTLHLQLIDMFINYYIRIRCNAGRIFSNTYSTYLHWPRYLP